MKAASCVVRTKKTVVVERELDEICRREGYVDQDLIIAAARPADSPLHPYFTWDDTIAAEKWRRVQATQLILAVRFLITVKESEQRLPEISCAGAVRKLLPQFGGGGFQLRADVLGMPDARRWLIARKIGILRGWLRETADIEELAELRIAIETLLAAQFSRRGA